MTLADDHIDQVLDGLPVTDTVYHDLAYTRPLTTRLFRTVAHGRQPGRTLLVGPNVALAQALVDQHWPVEIWHVPGVAITENLRSSVTRVGDLDTLFDRPPQDRAYDVVVLPFVVDATLVDPPVLLAAVHAMTRPEGRVIVTLRRAGALEARLRAMAGRSALTTQGTLRHSWSWPSATPRRRLDTEGVRAAAHAAGFRLVGAEPVIDALPTAGVDALPLLSWCRAHVAHLAKQALPAVRDTLVATLSPLSAPPPGGSPDLPTVSVVVVGHDLERARRLACQLDGQTYPRERITVHFATPDAAAANAALKQAPGDLVAFTDDLSQPPVGWVESGVRAMTAHTTAVAGGVLAAPGSAAPFLAMPDRQMRAGGRGLYLSANSFYRRDALLSVGGFDETVGGSWGWDTTAALRLRAAGFPVAEDQTAFVFRSYPFPADRSWMRDEFRRCRDLPLAVRRDPTLRRRALDHHVFASSRTRGFDVAVLGVALALARRRPWFAVLTVTPWLHSVMEYVDLWPPVQWRTTLRNLRGIVLRNVIWLAGLLVGSVRARRLVL